LTRAVACAANEIAEPGPTALDKLFADDVAAFNMLVRKHGLEPISCSRAGR
jgi:hypothetical protein